MSGTACDRDRELATAVASGEIPDSLQAHVFSCPDCSDALAAAMFLHREEASDEALPPLPEASYVWWRAQFERRSIASERATGVITIVQRAAVLSGGLLAIPLVRWGWPTLRSWIATVNPMALQPSLPPEAARPGLVIAVSLALVAAMVLLDRSGNCLEE